MPEPEPGPRILVGIDIVGVERVARIAAEHGARLEDVFTRGELAYCRRKRRPDEHLAARFAAKEAVLKALGSGLRRRMRWTDVEVVHDRGGRPGVHLHGDVAEWASRRGFSNVEVSLSHGAGLAVAHAVAVCSAPAPPPDREQAA